MGGGSFILTVNLCVTALLAATFLAISAYDRRNTAVRWAGWSFIFAAAYFVVENAIPFVADARLAVVAAFFLFLVSSAFLTLSVARQYHVRPPNLGMAALVIGATVAVYLAQDLPRHSLLRMATYQLPYAAMHLAAAAMIASGRRRRNRKDLALMALFATSALYFAMKPFLALTLGGWGASPQVYIETTYALASQSIGAVLIAAIALLLLLIFVGDMLADARARSESDTLSGLFNRGGFELRAASAIAAAQRRGRPLSIVTADLDRFKSINDTFGHACGDRVIAAFAGLLQETMAGHCFAGRIGGEEFAVLLPDTNLVAARLFAEHARTVFAGMRIDGIPQEKRMTASFGVAEMGDAETISDLLARADKALYLAKESGRDCVKIARRPERRHAVAYPGAAISLS